MVTFENVCRVHTKRQVIIKMCKFNMFITVVCVLFLIMLKEVTLGHTAGPFCSPPFPNLQVYPIGVIPKKHSSEWCTIFHLSYPKHHPTSVNAHIPPESYSLQYIKVDHAIAILQDLGPGCLMSKRHKISISQHSRPSL